MGKVKLYASEHCIPCQAVRAQLATDPNVEVVDIDTDAGFEEFTREVLSHGDGAIPSAYKDGKQCKVLFDKEVQEFFIECPEEDEEPPHD